MENNDLLLIDFFKPEGLHDRIILYYSNGNVEEIRGKEWDKKHYEDVAGQVADEDTIFRVTYLLKEHVAFQPVNNWSKNDLKNRLTPCLVIVPKKVFIDDFGFDIDTTPAWERPWPLYDLLLGHEQIIKIYYGDSFDDIHEKMMGVLV